MFSHTGKRSLLSFAPTTGGGVKHLINELKKYFESSCPLVSGKRLNVSCLDEKLHSCVIVPGSEKTVIAKYPDGGSLRQYVFAFSTREAFDASVRENLKVAKFYEDFEQWLEMQNSYGDFPDIGSEYECICLEPMSSGYLFDASGKTAKYQIKLRLIYEKN